VTSPIPTGGRATVCLILAFLVVAAFWPVFGHDFVGFDDETYVTGNRHVRQGVTGSGVRWAWSTFHAANWHPLTWMSHMLDWQLYGANPTGHHLTGLLLHVANALLLFLLLERMTGSTVRSALVALLFGLHPQHVESVAWVAERKDVLSTLFWLLAIGAYLRYVRAPGAGRYALVVLAMAAGLCAKPMLVTLPFTLLLLDYWPLRRLDPAASSGRAWGRLILEKTPLVALAVASSVVTVWAQRSGGALVSLEHHPLQAWLLGGSILILAAVTFGVWWGRRRYPYLLFGWLWYVGTLVPVIGLVQVGAQAMADRYTYVPLIGIFVMVVWGIPSVAGPMLSGRTTAPPAATEAVRRDTGLLAIVFLVVPLLTITTWTQLRHWRDDMSLATRALSVTRDNAIAHNQLGLALVRRGQAAGALPHYLEAVRISPGFAEAHNNLGGAFVALDRIDDAVEAYGEALELEPEYPEALINLGVALVRQGRLDEAIARFEEAVDLRPDYGKAHGNLAAAFFTLGDLDRARRELALARRSGFEPPANLADAIAGAERPD
jgi:tetratricopeptide (TPR) repeat protein